MPHNIARTITIAIGVENEMSDSEKKDRMDVRRVYVLSWSQ